MPLGLLLTAAGITTAALSSPGSSDGPPSGFSQAAARRVVTSLLPPGRVSWLPDSPESGQKPPASRSSATLRLRYDDGKGAAQITVGLSRLPETAQAQPADCPARAFHPYDHCTTRQLRNGVHLLVDRGYTDPVNAHSPRQWTAVLTTSDSSAQVLVGEQNTSGANTQVASRPDLPLDEQQIVALASAPGWASLLDGLSRPPAPPAAPSQAVLDQQTILGALDGALPSGVHAVRKGGSPKGYADALLDDGRTQTLLMITVQDWPPHQEQLEGIFKNAEPGRDGARLVTRQYPSTSGGRNAVEWDADVLYGDGRRVIVSELNALAFGLPASRANPPLSLEQLTSIAEGSALRS